MTDKQPRPGLLRPLFPAHSDRQHGFTAGDPPTGDISCHQGPYARVTMR
jgi:hypothetical protein